MPLHGCWLDKSRVCRGADLDAVDSERGVLGVERVHEALEPRLEVRGKLNVNSLYVVMASAISKRIKHNILTG